MNPSSHLKHERVQRGWSQGRLAELIGTDAGNVSRWERGYSSPSPYFQEKLCQLYEKNAQELGLLAKKQAGIPEEREEDFGCDAGIQTPQVEEAYSEHTSMGRLEAVPAISSRLLACLCYALGWLTGFLVLLFNRSNR